MRLPSNHSSDWIKIFSGKKTLKLNFLGTKILLSRLQREYKKNPSSIPKLATELRGFLEKNGKIANVQKDIEQMFN